MSSNLNSIVKTVKKKNSRRGSSKNRKIVEKVEEPKIEEKVEELDKPDEEVKVLTEKEAEKIIVQEALAESVGDDLDPELVRSLRMQSGMPEMKVLNLYPYCMKHGYINPVDLSAARLMCSICGSKMIKKKFLGEV